MSGQKSTICLLLVFGVLFSATQLILGQTRAIRPVTIQIPNQGQVELYKGSYALVIGASKYQDNAWGNLTSVMEDVKAVRQALEGQGFQVDTLLDPTEDILIDEINDFIDAHGYDRENRLIFYYAGHGYTQERNGRKFGYLVPVDAPNPYDNEREFFRKSIKMEQVLSWAKQIESKHALFVFDSCFSGSVLQSRAAAVPEDISFLTAKPVRQFISAGSANQTVPAISVFQPLFIRGINGQADLDKDGYVTGDELGMYLQKQVPRYQTGQTPQYGKILDPYLDEGNFVFEVENRRRPPTNKIEPSQQSKRVTLYISEDDSVDGRVSNPESWKSVRNSYFDRIYFGEVSNGVPNGQGTFTSPDGTKYVGEFKDGRFNGQGTSTFPEGTKYVGEFKDGRFNGQGTSTFPDGAKYVGEFKDNEWHGQGIFTWPDGGKDIGTFKDGRFVGENQSESKTVTLYTSEDTERNKRSDPDSWKTNRQLASDRVYVGEVINGVPNGVGTYTKSDGAKYVGGFLDGYPNGQGTYTSPDGEKYVGKFKDGYPNGQGTYTSPDGEKYVGEFMDGNRHGYGTLTTTDGRKYIGEWKDDKQHGQGTLTWPNGEKYEGEFKYGEVVKESKEAQLILSGDAALKKLKSTNECIGCSLVATQLIGINLQGSNLSKASLYSSDLTMADLSEANLSGAMLRKANLTETNLNAADLSYAILHYAKLVRADLRGANLKGANLGGAELIDATFCHTIMPDGSINNKDCTESKDTEKSSIKELEKQYNLQLYDQLRGQINAGPQFDKRLSVAIELQIEPNGVVSESRIKQSSGSQEFDLIVMMGLKAIQFPPLPLGLNENPPYIVTIRIQP